MLTPKVYKLACGHSVKLISVAPIFWSTLFGAKQAQRRADNETRKEAKSYCCNDYACRAKTGKPTHYSL